MKFLRPQPGQHQPAAAKRRGLQNPAAPPTSLPPLARPVALPLLSVVRRHLTPNSMVFRHALRLSLGLVVGYGILQAFSLDKGGTGSCSPCSSSASQATAPPAVAWCSGCSAPSPASSSACRASGSSPGCTCGLGSSRLAAFLFFARVRSNYSAAVCFITLYVLMAFSLLDGISFAILG